MRPSLSITIRDLAHLTNGQRPRDQYNEQMTSAARRVLALCSWPPAVALHKSHHPQP